MTNSTVKPKLIDLKLDDKPVVVIEDTLLMDINMLHVMIGEIEWSGMLFYEIESGSITDLANMKIKAHRMFPMGIGTAGGVEFDYSEVALKAYDLMPEVEDMMHGFIHTHHKMGAYFSGTDNDELQDNTHLYAQYFSLIASFNPDYKARVAFPCHKEEVIKITGEKGKVKRIKNDLGEVILYTDCNVVFTHDGKYIKAINDLRTATAEAKKKVVPPKKEVTGFTPSTKKQTIFPDYYTNGTPNLTGVSHVSVLAKWLMLDITYNGTLEHAIHNADTNIYLVDNPAIEYEEYLVTFAQADFEVRFRDSNKETKKDFIDSISSLHDTWNYKIPYRIRDGVSEVITELLIEEGHIKEIVS